VAYATPHSLRVAGHHRTVGYQVSQWTNSLSGRRLGFRIGWSGRSAG
jgi:hypothetical protein